MPHRTLVLAPVFHLCEHMIAMVLLLIACLDYHIVPFERRGQDDDGSFSGAEEQPPLSGTDNETEEEDDGGIDDEDEDKGGTDDEDEDEDEGGTDDEQGTAPGQSADNPRKPSVGQVVISELMVDSEAVYDKHGEWVELANLTPAWITLEGITLSDDGVDEVVLPNILLEPWGFVVLCANDDSWSNGGVDCDGDYKYDTLGGGFAMSNTEDEVVLTKPNGKVLDRVAWKNSEWAATGASMGVDPDALDHEDNDDLTSWCDQFAFLNGGDSVNPGQENDWCW